MPAAAVSAGGDGHASGSSRSTQLRPRAGAARSQDRPTTWGHGSRSSGRSTGSTRTRAILVLHHLDGRGLTEVATLLGIPVGTAKSRLFAARRALERALEREQ